MYLTPNPNIRHEILDFHVHFVGFLHLSFMGLRIKREENSIFLWLTTSCSAKTFNLVPKVGFTCGQRVALIMQLVALCLSSNAIPQNEVMVQIMAKQVSNMLGNQRGSMVSTCSTNYMGWGFNPTKRCLRRWFNIRRFSWFIISVSSGVVSSGNGTSHYLSKYALCYVKFKFKWVRIMKAPAKPFF